MTNEQLTMLYKVGKDIAQEESYGLALARVVDLPPKVLEIAEHVSKTLQAKAEAKKKSSKAFALAKRRKLVLSLRETLKQAEDSPMDDRSLCSWLRKLQEEFVSRMEQIENDVADEEDQLEVVEEAEEISTIAEGSSRNGT